MARAVTARKIIRRGAQDDFDPDFWTQVSPDERFTEAWRLSEEIWRLKGWDLGEPGMCRSVARVIRRRS